MSDLSFVTTIAVEKHLIGALSEPGTDALVVFHTLDKEARRHKTKPYLSGSSRNSYFELLVDEILRTMQLEGLSFLAGKSHTRRISVSDGDREVLINCRRTD